MNVSLAEKLLSKVMNWTPSQFAEHGLEMQALAEYKYDGYQQFSPGMRFTESLARWLHQFPVSDRETAFQYVKERLVFISDDEMNHLVSISYPDFVRPLLMNLAFASTGLESHQVRKISESQVFRKLERETLFLGLSDGARTDIFRRANKSLSNEQVRNTHELSAERVDSLLEDLRKDIKALGGGDVSSEAFKTVVLIDDFSGSGLSYARKDKTGKTTGKLGKFIGALSDSTNPTSKLVQKNFTLIVVLYMATTKAEGNLRQALEGLSKVFNFTVHIVVVQRLLEGTQIDATSAGKMASLIDGFYDDENETDATRVGGTDLRYGFNGCGLSIVLAHNTPNNSIGLLWAEGSKMRPLFPRVTRHKDFA
jgi:hypothetical protein